MLTIEEICQKYQVKEWDLVRLHTFGMLGVLATYRDPPPSSGLRIDIHFSREALPKFPPSEEVDMIQKMFDELHSGDNPTKAQRSVYYHAVKFAGAAMRYDSLMGERYHTSYDKAYNAVGEPYDVKRTISCGRLIDRLRVVPDDKAQYYYERLLDHNLARLCLDSRQRRSSLSRTLPMITKSESSTLVEVDPYFREEIIQAVIKDYAGELGQTRG